MKVTVKRFEGPYVVCIKEDGSIIDIKRINVPKDTQEGYVLDITDDRCIKIYDDNSLTKF